jgi:hypothetical protein
MVEKDGQAFFPTSTASHCQDHYTGAPYSPSSYVNATVIRQASWRSVESFQQNDAISDTGDQWQEKYFHVSQAQNIDVLHCAHRSDILSSMNCAYFSCIFFHPRKAVCAGRYRCWVTPTNQYFGLVAV